MVNVRHWYVEGVVQQPREFFTDGTCQLCHQWDTCLNAFAHPHMDSSCTCCIYILRSCEYSTLRFHWNEHTYAVPGRRMMRQKLHCIFLNFYRETRFRTEQKHMWWKIIYKDNLMFNVDITSCFKNCTSILSMLPQNGTGYQSLYGT
jgi:hypothetical protein